VADRETSLGKLLVGDIFHAEAPNGASLICLVTVLTEATIEARTLTHQMQLEFDRKTGVAAWDGESKFGDEPIISRSTRLPLFRSRFTT